MLYRITSRAGTEYGTWPGATADEAFAAMVKAGGASDGAEGCPEDWNIVEVTSYEVLRRSASSISISSGRGELLQSGSERFGNLDLYDALVECDARNLLLGEAVADRWSIEPAPTEADLLDATDGTGAIAPDAVNAYLIAVLGVGQAEADRLTSCERW